MSFSFIPTNEAFALFACTPNFVPTPSFVPHRVILEQTQDFVRKLLWRLSLSFSGDSPRFGLLPSTAWPPAKLVPSHACGLSRRVLHGVRSLLRAHHDCHFASNVTCNPPNVFKAIQQSGNTVCTADKGGRWTVVPSTSYHDEALRQLRNNSFYEEISQQSKVDFTAQKIRQCLQILHSKKFITKKELLFLCPPTSPRPRRFKLLPKLHKASWPDPAMPPGRPIVADTSSATRNAGEIIEYFLQPLCHKIPSHLKDTRHLIAILRNLVIPPRCTLFTLDVESLYTNVPIDEGIECIASMFRAHPDPKRPDRTLLTLLKLILTSNVFHYENLTFSQSHGVAMGQVFGGSFANLFLSYWEEAAIASFDTQPHSWLRFQDDIFGVWPHDVTILHSFVDHLNSCHPKIRVKLTEGPCVSFLDLTIFLSNSQLFYKPFFKDTASHMVLTPTSHHPSSAFHGLLYGEILRLSVNSSSSQDFYAALSTVTPVWRRQGFSRTAIREAKRRVLLSTGQLLNWGPGMYPCRQPSCPVCPFASTTSTYRDSTSPLTFPITARLNCSSTNVIYVIECRSCSSKYVGETSRALGTRMRQHLRAISTGSECAVHKHFREVCGPASFSFYAIAHHPREHVRKIKEEKWIAALHTRLPDGLNTARSAVPPRTNLILPFCACSTRVAAALKRWVPRDLFRVAYRRTSNLREIGSRARRDPPHITIPHQSTR